MDNIFVTCEEGGSEDCYFNTVGRFADCRFDCAKARPKTETAGDSVILDMLTRHHTPIVTDQDLISSFAVPGRTEIFTATQEGFIYFLEPDFEGCFDDMAFFDILSEFAKENETDPPSFEQVIAAFKRVEKKYQAVQELCGRYISKPALAAEFAKYTLRTGYIPNEIVSTLHSCFGFDKWKRGEEELYKKCLLKFVEVEQGKNNFHWMLWRESIPKEYKAILSGTLVTNAPGGMFLIDLSTQTLRFKSVKYEPALGRFPTPNPSESRIAHFQGVHQKQALIITEIDGSDSHYELPLKFCEVTGIDWSDDNNACICTKQGCYIFTIGTIRIKKIECSRNHNKVTYFPEFRFKENTCWCLPNNNFLVLTNGYANSDGRGRWPSTQTLFLFDDKKQILIRLTEWINFNFTNTCFLKKR